MFQITSTKTMTAVAAGYATRAAAHEAAESWPGLDYIVEETPARTVIRTNLVTNARTDNQVKDAVRTLNRKLAGLISWRGIPTTLYTLEATLEDGAIAIRLAEPDRTLTDQPDVIHAETFLDVNMHAVALYRMGKATYHQGMGAAIAAYLAEPPATI